MLNSSPYGWQITKSQDLRRTQFQATVRDDVFSDTETEFRSDSSTWISFAVRTDRLNFSRVADEGYKRRGPTGQGERSDFVKQERDGLTDVNILLERNPATMSAVQGTQNGPRKITKSQNNGIKIV